MYLENYKGLCKSRSTNAEYPLDLLDGIKREFDKALSGGILGTTYILEKLETLKQHVKWCNEVAHEQWEEANGNEEPSTGEPEQFSAGYNGGYGQSTFEDD